MALDHHAPPLVLRDGWADDVVSRYTGSGRHYHTVEHLDEMLDAWAEQTWDDPVATWVAVLLHDAIYVVGANDNEAQSAELVPGWVATFVPQPEAVDVARVQALIQETARHGDHGPLDADTARFVDCDMAILAADPERFAAYEDQVRREWEPLVGVEGYRSGRRRFFAGLLEGRIFQSGAFAQHEARARANIASALAGGTRD